MSAATTRTSVNPVTDTTGHDAEDYRRPTDGDRRDRRAATDPMVVDPIAPGLYHVYSGETDRYTVDLVGGVCECGDYRYREPADGCKHIRRVNMTIGVRAIPRVTDARIDPTLHAQRARLLGGEA